MAAARGTASTPSPELTFFLLSPLELQHHIIVSNKSVDRCIQVKDIPEKQTVLPTELGDHHCHQPIAERLERETPCQLVLRSYTPMLLLSRCIFFSFSYQGHVGFKGSHHKPPPGLKFRGRVQGNCCAKPVSCNRKNVVYFQISNAAHLRLMISFCCFLAFQLRGWRDLTLDCSHMTFTAICLELQELLPGD